jgi:acetyl-CoA carboxylase biotin carboxyl carrier protein
MTPADPVCDDASDRAGDGGRPPAGRCQEGPRMSEVVRADMVANVAEVNVTVGDRVDAGTALVLLESMKMEIPVLCELPGTVAEIQVSPGDVIQEGDVIVVLT